MNRLPKVTFDQMKKRGQGKTGRGVLLDIFFNRHSDLFPLCSFPVKNLLLHHFSPSTGVSSYSGNYFRPSPG